jgi:hypothetical protein
MKKLVENWQKFLKEGENPFGVPVSDDQKVFISKNKFEGFRPAKQREKAGYKPQGLWYACGDSWIEWTKSEQPDWLEKSKYLYEISTTPSILVIDTPEKFKAFEEEYVDNGPNADKFSNWIDWVRVAKDYDGIEICPYRGDFREESDWYYTWDVASGCIWSPSGIKDVKLIGSKDVE